MMHCAKNYCSIYVQRFIVIVFVLTAALTSQAQYKPYEMILTANAHGQTYFPFELVNNLIIIKLSINQSAPMNFILDSGVKTAIITELNANDSLVLNSTEEVKIMGMGTGDAIPAIQSNGNMFRIEDAVGYNHIVHVLLRNPFNMSERLGMRIHGIIGYDVFKNFVVEIDYLNKYIVLFDTTRYRHRNINKRYGVTLPLIVERSKSYIQVPVHTHADSTQIVKLLLDTGSSDALWLISDTTKKIFPLEKNIDCFLGMGLNGEIFGKKTRISSIEFGQMLVKRPITSFPDTASFNQINIADGRNGSIGGELLRRFKVIIDYGGEKITFIRNKHIGQDFFYNMSGIDVIQPYLGLPYFEVSDVRPNSVADKAGVKIGDQIKTINYKHDSEFNLEDMNQLLNGKSGRKIRMQVIRENVSYTFKFQLFDEL